MRTKELKKKTLKIEKFKLLKFSNTHTIIGGGGTDGGQGETILTDPTGIGRPTITKGE